MIMDMTKVAAPSFLFGIHMHSKNLSTPLSSQGNLQYADNHRMKGDRYSSSTPGCLFDSNGHAFACVQTTRTIGAPHVASFAPFAGALEFSSQRSL